MNDCFADTSFYIALVEANDAAHERAVTISSTVRRTITTDFVTVELTSYFAASHRRGLIAAFCQDLQANPNVTVVGATRQWIERGLAHYATRPDKQWSLVDCISFLIMEELHLQSALSSDNHFEQAGFRALMI